MIVVLPMAGRGSRFEGSGYARPKPLILVEGIPMFIRSLESIKDIAYSKLVVVALSEHEKLYGISHYLMQYNIRNAELVLLEDVTEGQLCTVLAAKDHFQVLEDVLVIGSDTIVQSEISQHIARRPAHCKGLISVADMPGDRWSFAATDETGRVLQVAEKQRISPHASTGMYYFSDAIEFTRYSEELINAKETTKGEYYVIPVYQKLIAEGGFVGISQAEAMWDLGTPDALASFLKRQS